MNDVSAFAAAKPFWGKITWNWYVDGFWGSKGVV